MARSRGGRVPVRRPVPVMHRWPRIQYQCLDVGWPWSIWERAVRDDGSRGSRAAFRDSGEISRGDARGAGDGMAASAHSQGGGAVDVFLDTMEALDKEKPIAASRSHLIHASFQSKEAIARAKRLGILADVQAPWLYLDAPALEKVVGYDGMRMFYPLRSYLDAGVLIGGGSDHMIGHDKNRAVNPYNPFLNMWVAVARQTIAGKVVHAEEKITREEALKMHSIWAAYFQFEEKEKGSLEVGKLADLVVLDRDYLTCPEDEIRKIEPVTTIVEGKIVF